MSAIVCNIFRALSTFVSYCRPNRSPPPSPSDAFPKRKPCRHMLPSDSPSSEGGANRERRWSYPRPRPTFIIPSPPHPGCGTFSTGICACETEDHIYMLQHSTRQLSASATLPVSTPMTPHLSPFHADVFHQDEDQDEEEEEWIAQWLKDMHIVESDSESDTEHSTISSSSNTRVGSDPDEDFFAPLPGQTKLESLLGPKEERVGAVLDEVEKPSPPRMHKSKRLRGVTTSLHLQRYDRSVSPCPAPRRRISI